MPEIDEMDVLDAMESHGGSFVGGKKNTSCSATESPQNTAIFMSWEVEEVFIIRPVPKARKQCKKK